MEAKIQQDNNNRQVIREAIRRIALGKAIDRVDLAPIGNSGIGTARMIHGYVSKIHDNPEDSEFNDYYGTIDVREYPDETGSSEPITYKGVSLSGIQNNTEGILIIPSLFSDVTIVSDAASKNAYILNYSHANKIQFQSHQWVTINACETEELDPNDSDSPDFDELPKTGNEANTRFTPGEISTIVKNKNGKSSSISIQPETISTKIDKTETLQTTDIIQQKVGGTSISVGDKKITLGDSTATEPLVLGNQLAQLMLDFLMECSKITTPTLMGTMPAINVPNFSSLTAKIQKFLSQTSYTK